MFTLPLLNLGFPSSPVSTTQLTLLCVAVNPSSWVASKTEDVELQLPPTCSFLQLLGDDAGMDVDVPVGSLGLPAGFLPPAWFFSSSLLLLLDHFNHVIHIHF